MQLFVANKEQTPEITGILLANRSKLLRFLKDFTTVEKGNNNKLLNMRHTYGNFSACTQLSKFQNYLCIYIYSKTDHSSLLDADDKKFEADKATVISDILALNGAEK